MRIQRKIRQHRRDFTAIYECEHCGHTLERGEAVNPQTVIALLDEIDVLNDQLEVMGMRGK